MRSGSASRHERLLQLFERNALRSRDAGLFRIRVEDQVLEGDLLTIEGRRVVNFASCAYLGLNLDPRLKAGAIDAIERFGPVFSSSTAYTSIDLYQKLEERLSRIFNASVVIPTTTTLGHLAALPILVGDGDSVLVDSQAHATVHLATQILQAEGIPVLTLPHNNLGALEAAIDEASRKFRSVWYLADGVYSMFGDVAPVSAVYELLDAYPNLHVYFDDAHGFGWTGESGRGWVLKDRPFHPRMVVIVSLAKSFGSGGAAIAFPEPAMAQRVQLCGGTLTFSGPLHPAELGASIAAAEIHLSDELIDLQTRIHRQIVFVREALVGGGLPVVALDPTPVWFVRVGGLTQAMDLARRMLNDGFYLNLASFPAVAPAQSGLRFTHTLYHSEDQILAMIEALRHHLQAIVGEPGVVIDLTALEAEISAPGSGSTTG
jgi:7-keto-8-aminopelargonate synthetase-like enzyme